jgi:hypothetical protein
MWLFRMQRLCARSARGHSNHFYKGELCRHMSDEEGHKEFLDAEEN